MLEFLIIFVVISIVSGGYAFIPFAFIIGFYLLVTIFLSIYFMIDRYIFGNYMKNWLGEYFLK
jgi:hypothetical protein